MLKYCDECESYVELEEGRCSVCGMKLINKRWKRQLDAWDDNNEEWGTEDEAEELGEVKI